MLLTLLLRPYSDFEYFDSELLGSMGGGETNWFYVNHPRMYRGEINHEPYVLCPGIWLKVSQRLALSYTDWRGVEVS